MAKDKKLAEAAYQLLKEELIFGKLLPGDKLPEIVLAERLQMSRTPIREALRHLERDGLVVFSGNRASVRSYTPEEVIQLYELRQLLEVHAAVEAVGNISRDALDKLEFCCREFERLLPELEKKRSSGEDHSELDVEIALNDFNFHMTIIAQSSNCFIRKLSLELHLAMLSVSRTAGLDPTLEKLPDMRSKTHRELYQAICQRDAGKVRELFTKHISESRTVIGKRSGLSRNARSLFRETMKEF